MSWLEKSRARISIAEEYHHYNARIIADRYSQETSVVRRAFNREVSVVPSIRRRKNLEYDGLDASDLNRALRASLREHDSLGMRFECAERDGFFVSDAGTQGFDFAYIDEEANTARYRNLCLGPVALQNGADLWTRPVRRSIGLRELPDNHPIHSVPVGAPFAVERKAPIVLGEIQMGNWALLYYDLFKALSALDAVGLDLYIYVCPTGRLSELVSDGTVNYGNTRQVLLEKASVLRFPIWLIGLDIGDFR